MSSNKTLTFCAEFAKLTSLNDAIVFYCLQSLIPNAKTSTPRTEGIIKTWYEIESKQLLQQLDFWSPNQIEAILQSLRDMGQLYTGSASIVESPTLKFYISDDLLDEQCETSPQSNNVISNAVVRGINDGWQPSDDIIARTRTYAIPESFVKTNIQYFIDHYKHSPKKERGWEWDNLFVKWCRSEWVKYESQQHSLDKQPRPLSENWTPDALFFKSLESAKIPNEFAMNQLYSFILYWRDHGGSRPSWNKSFLEHVSYQWKKHQKEQQQSSNQPRSTREISLEEKLNDVSWAFD